MSVIKKLGIMMASVFLLAGLAFAGELIESEAAQYFKEGLKAQRERNFSAARVAYQKVMLLAPNNKDFQKYISNNMGVILFEEGAINEAEAVFKDVLSLDPSYTPAQMNLGLVYEKQGDRLTILEYWAKVFRWEESKPKNFTLEEGPSEKKKQK